MATKITTVSLDEKSSALVEQEIASGRYATAQEVVRAGLRLLDDRQAARERLRAAIQEGIDSEDMGPLDVEAFLRSKDADERRSCAA